MPIVKKVVISYCLTSLTKCVKKITVKHFNFNIPYTFFIILIFYQPPSTWKSADSSITTTGMQAYTGIHMFSYLYME